MNTFHSKSTLLLFAAILFLMSMPKLVVDRTREATVSSFAPAWENLAYYKRFASTLFLGSFFTRNTEQENPLNFSLSEQVEQLQLENELMRLQLSRIQDFQKKEYSLNQLSSFETIPARVIFRSPQSWNSSLWVNVGTSDNDGYERPIIVKNSPVLVGDSVIGILDFVGKHQSRVRLITDSNLSLSVRAVREAQFTDQETKKWFLAKGELHGDSAPLWRTQGEKLKGIGFNYDFSDEKGPARDLRSGTSIKKEPHFPSMPLICVGDQLVTTGMDGVFPEELKVAEVTHIEPLKEGDYYYELEAKPTAGALEDLSLVFIIAPMGYDFTDQP